MTNDIAVSIVLYNNRPEQYEPLVHTILDSPRVATLWLIDHSPKALPVVMPDHPRVVRIHDPSNPGFGAGHNRALRDSLVRGRYHAVVNPDIHMDRELLSQLADYMDGKPEVGSVMPTIRDSFGEVSNQGRLLPSPWDLMGRRWLPRLWDHRKSRYEVLLEPEEGPKNVPNLSGAFLFLRNEALKVSGLFDERFFLYCEDVDLVRRLHQSHRTEALPHLQAVHAHQRSSYKGLWMTLVHSWSAIQYFRKWGWFHDPQRTQFNLRATSG